MCGVIKMHYYRLIHTKAMWIIMLMTAVVMFFSTQPIDIGDKSIQDSLASNIIKGVQNGNILILLIIMISILVTGITSTGYSKNIAGYLQNKYKDTLAYVLITASLILCMFIISVATITIGTYVYNEPFTLGDLSRIVSYLGTQFFLYLAYGMFIICVGKLTQSNGTTIAIGILYVMIFENLLYGLLEKVFGDKVTEYSIFQNIYTISPDSSGKMYLIAYITGIIYIVLFFLLGNVKKKNL